MERPRKHSPIATLALALLCAFTLAACGGSTSAESVAGTVWQLTAISVEGDGAVADCTAEEYLAENGIEYRLEFPDDSSAALVRTQYSGRFGSEAITDLGYTLSGNRLSFTARNEAVFETVSFDGSTLVLRFDDARGTVTTFTFEKAEVEEAPEEPAAEEGAPEEQPAEDAAAAEETPQEEAFVEDALEDGQTVQVPCGVIATVPRLYAGRGARWVAYDEGMNLEVPNDGIRVVANIDWSERAEHSSEAKEEKWLIGTAIYNGMKRDVWLHIPYVGAHPLEQPRGERRAGLRAVARRRGRRRALMDLDLHGCRRDHRSDRGVGKDDAVLGCVGIRLAGSQRGARLRARCRHERLRRRGLPHDRLGQPQQQPLVRGHARLPRQRGRRADAARAGSGRRLFGRLHQVFGKLYRLAELRDETVLHVPLAALDLGQEALAHADVLGRDLHELVVHDVLERLLERERARGRELHGDVRGR